MNKNDAQNLATLLAGKAGIGVPRSVEPLAGGRNNRVFRVDFTGGTAAVLKAYHQDPRDPRDRLQAEWNFLSYVGARGVGKVPRPLASDPPKHAALYSFVPGTRATVVDDDLVRQAVAFAIAINQTPHQPEQLAPASEACFTLNGHLETVDRRVARLRDLDADAPHIDEARAFVDNRLNALWENVRTSIVRQAGVRGVPLEAAVVRSVVSPSDFGFHNALIDTKGQATFLDFEYAGRDDPAKLICDFFCQPELVVPFGCYAEFTGALAAGLGLQDEDLWRARLLLDAYRVKWVCIMLNEFSAVDARRRAFASAQNGDRRALHQLASAQRYLDLVTP